MRSGFPAVALSPASVAVPPTLSSSAAVVAAEGQPASLEIVTLDDRLIEAARREGFVVRAAISRPGDLPA